MMGVLDYYSDTLMLTIIMLSNYVEKEPKELKD
jgi:hypothetical protein